MTPNISANNSVNKEAPALSITWQKVRGAVLFADLVNFFPIARRMPLDDLGGFLQLLYSSWGNEVARRRGEIVDYLGDSVIAFYRCGGCGGADPEWCATQTAFHLVKDLKKWREDLEINVAISTGEVLEGRWEDVNQPGRVMRSMVGDVVNRTAVMASGRLKGIHTSRSVIEILGPRVAHEKVMIRFPGQPEDEAVFRLIALKL
ncbi:MAG: adenylate/guanylate cyclase domain-containing protein [Candidatus Ozemobacteraceae bacterium]